MKNFFKSKFGTVLILIATLGLAGVAVYTAIRLFQLRQAPVAPNVPTSKPAAAVPASCTALSFTLTTSTPTPTPSPTPSPTPTQTPAPTKTPTPAPIVQATPTKTVSPTKTPTPEPEAELPVAGTSWPTVLGASAGVVILVVSLLLAL